MQTAPYFLHKSSMSEPSLGYTIILYLQAISSPLCHGLRRFHRDAVARGLAKYRRSSSAYSISPRTWLVKIKTGGHKPPNIFSISNSKEKVNPQIHKDKQNLRFI